MIKDKLFELGQGTIKIQGPFHDKLEIVVEKTLKKLNYEKLADYFRYQLDPFATGEFWGKTIRAGSIAYKYNQDKDLLTILDKTVDDMLAIQREIGFLSTSPVDKQPKGSAGSDLWERKYVMLGLLSYYDITKREDVLEALKKHCDYTINQVGNPPKTPITDTGWAFYGIESSSILEPVVRLYHITKEERYFDFARYIIDSGACKRENLFEGIYGGKDPKDIGNNGNPKESIAKAYEMMSCFEGLIEFYRASGEEKYRETALIFYDKLIEQEITLLGSGGADRPYNLGPGTGEQWNYTAYEQTNPDIDLMMETCVTVTWIKLCYQLFRLTGDSKIGDQIEISAYNALLGSIRPDGKFYEYFPRFNGARNTKVNYSFNIDGFDLSCCTANGPTASALIPFLGFMGHEGGLCINFYIPAKLKTEDISFKLETDYPVTGNVSLIIEEGSKQDLDLIFRIPVWTKSFKLLLNGKPFEVAKEGYASVKRTWQKGDRIDISIDMTGRVYDAPLGSNPLGHDFVAIMRGPILLARDKRMGDNISEPVSFYHLNGKEPKIELTGKEAGSILQVRVETDQGYIKMIDYSSAGNTWESDSDFASWLPRKA